MTPLEVDTIAIPRPFNTRGISDAPLYFLKPGREALCNFVIAATFVDALYFKAGMHSSEMNGAGTLSIGGTTYSVTETISGSGFLAGAGIEVDDTRYGLTYYSDMGGDGDSDVVFIYGGIKF